MSRADLTFALILGLCSITSARADSLAQQAFNELATLVGEWEGRYSNGRSHQVSFALTANDSVIVETWSMSPTRRSLTLYALDGERLIATHYCPQGNQPRLVLTGQDANHDYHFAFLDGTSLQDPQGSHQHALQIHIDSAQAFSRSESYVSNAQLELREVEAGERVSYRRISR